MKIMLCIIMANLAIILFCLVGAGLRFEPPSFPTFLTIWGVTVIISILIGSIFA